VIVLGLAAWQSPMFLLDSRSLLMSAICLVKGRHPFSRTYGANLPISLSSVVPTRLGLLSQRYLCRFSVRSVVSPFHGLRDLKDFRTHDFARFSPLRHSTGFGVWTGRVPRSSYPKASAFGDDRHGNINPFPFLLSRLTDRIRTG
jgi:hypothetical protein